MRRFKDVNQQENTNMSDASTEREDESEFRERVRRIIDEDRDILDELA